MEFGIIIVWLVCGVISSQVASGKGRSGAGWFAIGFLLGPLGLIWSLVLAEDKEGLMERGEMRKCPSCAEFIKTAATHCRYCGQATPLKKGDWHGQTTQQGPGEDVPGA